MGFLWRLSDHWQLGGFYRDGSSFQMDGVETTGPAVEPFEAAGEIVATASDVPVSFPDVWGLGVAYRTADGALTVSFEWDRVGYSTILDDLGESALTSNTGAAIDDADELRVGAEYALLERKPILAFRLGAWLDPDHQIHATVNDPVGRALFPEGSDEIHYAAGFGVALERFQVDLGVDFSDLVDTFSISAIYNF